MSYLGLDVGTTSTKIVALDLEGKILARATSSYPTLREAEGAAEIDPHVLIQAMWTVLGRVASKLHGDPPQSLAVSALGEAIVAVDPAGHPLGKLTLAMDYRGRPKYEAFCQRFGQERLMALTGHPIHPMFTLAKLIGLREEPPQRSNLRYLDAQALVVQALSGHPVTDPSMASRTQMFDVDRMVWAEEILDAIGLNPEELPEVAPSGTVVGRIRPAAARATGLPADLVVATGGFDQACASVGANVIEVGTALENTGTTLCIGLTRAERVQGHTLETAGYQWSRHVAAGHFFLNAGSQAGGVVLEWFDKLMGGTGTDSIAARLARLPPGPSRVRVLSDFAGSSAPHPDPSKRAQVRELSFSSTREDVFAAAVDSLDFEARAILEHAEHHTGPVKALTVSGSPPRAEAWMQRKADTYGRPIRQVSVPDTSALGAAILAAIATGAFEGPREAASAWVRTERSYEPDEGRALEFRDAYLSFLTTREERNAPCGVRS